MARYFYRYENMWLYADGRNKAEVEERVAEFADEVLTRRQADLRSETDGDLRACIENSAMCDILCS